MATLRFDETGYILVDNHNVPQGLDPNSGGYPYPANTIKQIHKFGALSLAEEYVSMFPNLSIKHIQITVRELQTV